MLNVTSHNFNSFRTQAKTVPRPSFNPAKLSIFYYNDTHGNSDQFAGIMESAKNFKAKNHDSVSFVLSAGDNVSGADISKNSFVFDLMQNIMGVDVSAVGNHEIDGGSSGFSKAIETDGKLQFVATNF